MDAFSDPSKPDSMLSPESQKLKKELFRKEGQLNEQSLKSYKKRFTAYMQGLSNASERLNSVQKEEVAAEAEEDDDGDFNATKSYSVCVHRYIRYVYMYINIYLYILYICRNNDCSQSLSIWMHHSMSFLFCMCVSGEDAHDVPALDDKADAASVKPPDSMAHLDFEKYQLLKDLIRLTSTSKKLVFGAVYEGEPVSPDEPSSCSYLLENLKTPELGGIPRDEIYAELKNDITKEAKQRRDYGFPDGETATLSNIWMT